MTKNTSLVFLKSKKIPGSTKIILEKHRLFKAKFSRATERKVSIKRINQPQKPTKKSNIYIFNYAMKSLAIVMIVSLNALGLSSIGTTAAYYFDTETSTNNSYVAGEVDFGLAGTPYSLIETAVSLMSGTTTTRDIKVILEVNSNPFWYHASSTDFGVDPDFCDTLSLKSFLEGVENYSGPLKNFLASATTTLNNWRFDIGTNVNSYNKI